MEKEDFSWIVIRYSRTSLNPIFTSFYGNWYLTQVSNLSCETHVFSNLKNWSSFDPMEMFFFSLILGKWLFFLPDEWINKKFAKAFGSIQSFSFRSFGASFFAASLHFFISSPPQRWIASIIKGRVSSLNRKNNWRIGKTSILAPPSPYRIDVIILTPPTFISRLTHGSPIFLTEFWQFWKFDTLVFQVQSRGGQNYYIFTVKSKLNPFYIKLCFSNHVFFYVFIFFSKTHTLLWNNFVQLSF